MSSKRTLPRAPRPPMTSLILMVVFYLVGSILISLKGLPMLSIGIDIAVLMVCFLWYPFMILGAFYYAYFEKRPEDKASAKERD